VLATPFVFLYLCLNSNSAAVASRRATNLATYISIHILAKKLSVLRFQKMLYTHQFNKFRHFTVSVVDPDPHGNCPKFTNKPGFLHFKKVLVSS
jgi:hypothetical protein